MSEDRLKALLDSPQILIIQLKNVVGGCKLLLTLIDGCWSGSWCLLSVISMSGMLYLQKLDTGKSARWQAEMNLCSMTLPFCNVTAVLRRSYHLFKNCSKMKIAIEGCAHGELDKIYETMQALEKKNEFKLVNDFGSDQTREKLLPLIFRPVPELNLHQYLRHRT
ncbi:Lariat debranching enzyme B [Nymphon striatum]|nr:Lariat debranching enzyme B [Nymphon striatum]